MFRAEKITKSFKSDFWAKPSLVLDELSFEISKGSITGFLGANGAGKTTTIKIMMQFIGSDSGKCYFAEDLGKSRKEIFSNVGYVPERPYFYPDLTGREYLQYMGGLQSLSFDHITKIGENWADRMKIYPALDKKIRSYSKGMLQRLGFVSSVLHSPQFVILDEPLSGLDPVGRKEMKDSLVELKERGTTIFFSSHIVSDVEEVCDKVIVIEEGRLVHDGGIVELIERHMNPNFIIRVHKRADLALNQLFLNGQPDSQGYTYTVLGSKKDEFIKKCVENNLEIFSVNQARPTLEEIIYNLRE